MKVKCIKDHVTKTKGFFSKESYTERVNGLTEGKFYEVVVAPCPSVEGTGVMMTLHTTFNFMLYNDNGKWEIYDTDLFVPERE